jgi:CheY-like chemotaxis protein
VLLDIGLPGLDGYQVAGQLRQDEELRRATIIAVWGYGQQRDREQSRQSGCDDHHVKPVDCSQLLTLLAAVEPRPQTARP